MRISGRAGLPADGLGTFQVRIVHADQLAALGGGDLQRVIAAEMPGAGEADTKTRLGHGILMADARIAGRYGRYGGTGGLTQACRAAPRSIKPSISLGSVRADHRFGACERRKAIMSTGWRSVTGYRRQSPRCSSSAENQIARYRAPPDRQDRLRAAGGGMRAESGGGPGRNRTGIRGFAVRCITTLPPDRGLRPLDRSPSPCRSSPHP